MQPTDHAKRNKKDVEAALEEHEQANPSSANCGALPCSAAWQKTAVSKRRQHAGCGATASWPSNSRPHAPMLNCTSSNDHPATSLLNQATTSRTLWAWA